MLEQLSRCKPTLTARYGVARLAPFGSTARDAARPGSDIDILVSFDGPATSARYFGVQFFLEELLVRRGYLGIDNDTLWSIIVSDAPALLPSLRAIKAASS